MARKTVYIAATKWLNPGRAYCHGILSAMMTAKGIHHVSTLTDLTVRPRTKQQARDILAMLELLPALEPGVTVDVVGKRILTREQFKRTEP